MADVKYIQYTSRIKSTAYDGVLVESDQMFDVAEGKSQKVLNKQFKDGLKSITDKVDSTIGGLFHYKGSKQTFDEVKAIVGAKQGDVWNVVSAFAIPVAGSSPEVYPGGTNVVYDGQKWDPLGGTLSEFLSKSEAQNTYYKKADAAEAHQALEGKIGKKVETSVYQTKVDAIDKTLDGHDTRITNNATAISGLQKTVGDHTADISGHEKRIKAGENTALCAFTDVVASVTGAISASQQSGYAICYAEMQNCFFAMVKDSSGSTKYYKNWPTDSMYNEKDPVSGQYVARADKLYVRFTEGKVKHYAYHPTHRKLVEVPIFVPKETSDAIDKCKSDLSAITNRVAALENLLKMA